MILSFCPKKSKNIFLKKNFASRSMSPKDLKLPIDAGKLKQLKSMTSPLSKIAKGVQNIGMNLDPRKIAKVFIYKYLNLIKKKYVSSI